MDFPRMKVQDKELNHIFHKFCQRQLNINGGLHQMFKNFVFVSPSFINGLAPQFW